MTVDTTMTLCGVALILWALLVRPTETTKPIHELVTITLTDVNGRDIAQFPVRRGGGAYTTKLLDINIGGFRID